MRGRQQIRERWYAEVLRSSAIGPACRTLLMHLACGTDPATGERLMTPGGLAANKVSVYAEAFGITPEQIAKRIAEAKKAGLLLWDEHSGRNGNASRYWAQLPEGGKLPAPESLAGLIATGRLDNPAPAVQVPPMRVPTRARKVPRMGVPRCVTADTRRVIQVPRMGVPNVCARVRATYRNPEHEAAHLHSRAALAAPPTGTSRSNTRTTPRPLLVVARSGATEDHSPVTDHGTAAHGDQSETRPTTHGDDNVNAAEAKTSPRTCRKCRRPLAYGMTMLGKTRCNDCATAPATAQAAS